MTDAAQPSASSSARPAIEDALMRLCEALGIKAPSGAQVQVAVEEIIWLVSAAMVEAVAIDNARMDHG